MNSLTNAMAKRYEEKTPLGNIAISSGKRRGARKLGAILNLTKIQIPQEEILNKIKYTNMHYY